MIHRFNKVLTAAIAIGFWMGLALTGMQVHAAVEEWPAVEDFANYPPQIEEALGYAACYNPWRAAALVEPVARIAGDERVRARAFWVQAVGWGKFCLEYRTDRFEEAYRQARDQALKLNPELATDQLAYLDVMLEFHVHHPEMAEQNRTTYTQRLLDRPDDPVAAYRAGLACWQSVILTKGIEPERRESLLDEATRCLRAATSGLPGCYEPAAYYVTVAIQKQTTDTEALEFARRLPELYGGRPYYFDSRGPALLELDTEKILAHLPEDQYLERLRQLPENPERDWALAMTNANRADPDWKKKAVIYQEFADKAESGKLPLRGYNLHLLASAYYKLGGSQFGAKREAESLFTYGKLSAISPHYVHLHYNLGVVKIELSDELSDSARRRAMLQSARREFEDQLDFCWHGGGKEEFREWIDRIDKQLKEQPDERQ